MYPADLGIKFKFGEEVEVLDYDIRARIKGKIKDIDCYVITFHGVGETNLGNFTIKFGNPNRHLPLEWGKFAGFRNEFIVPSYLMKKVII